VALFVRLMCAHPLWLGVVIGINFAIVVLAAPFCTGWRQLLPVLAFGRKVVSAWCVSYVRATRFTVEWSNFLGLGWQLTEKSV